MKPSSFPTSARQLVCGLLFACLLAAVASAQPLPALLAVPAGLPAEIQAGLAAGRDNLEQERHVFLEDARQFNALSADAQTDAEFKTLNDRRAEHINRSNAFNREVNEAVAALRAPNTNQEDIRVMNAMIALAKRLEWSPEKLARFEVALISLRNTHVHGGGAERAAIQDAWRDIEARSQSEDLAREASRGDGQELYGSGTQTQFEDCTIFALASAAGLPYGVAGTRAAELLRQGDWRNAADRANPETAIEQRGLSAGEVIMLAEDFGQAEVLHSIDFPVALREGGPVLVGVVPNDGVGAHEVVITKAFEHDGQYPWYEMIESYNGPQRRYFLSAGELNTMLLQNGVVFRREPGSTVPLLR